LGPLENDPGLADWFLDWLAHLFQQPQAKIGIAVALRGGQGAGKSIVGAVLKKLLGRYQVVVDKPDQVVGRFNSHLASCLLLQAEEAFWGGTRSAAGALKHLVTGEQLVIERKGIDSVEMRIPGESVH
jgi:phage/plasmid-associated DNA primase